MDMLAPTSAQLCEFAPKKPNGPLSRRCVHCGEHQDKHGTPPSSSIQQLSGPTQLSEEQGAGAEGVPTPEFQTLGDGTVGLEVVVLDRECHLVRNLLGLEAQADLLRYILDRDRTPDKNPKAMVSGPKTLQLGEEGPSMRFVPGQKSLVTDIIAQATATLNQVVCTGVDLGSWRSISMAAIQYESPGGCFPPHIDHCDNSFVFLISLGCSANFMVKSPQMEAQCFFKFQSGDMLVFNASTQAAILHGVMSIDDERSNPPNLRDAFQMSRNHRYGVQCRLYF